jgi:peptide/nickel transport system substrate-binding protein
MKFLRPVATLAALVVAATGLAACTASPAADEASVLRLGSGASELTFNPAFIGGGIDANWHISAVYDSLLVWPQGTGIAGEGLQPRVATEWEYSEGNTVLSLRLRDDVVFSDGTPLDAELVKTNIETAMSTEAGYYDAPYYATIEEIAVAGDHELVVHLSRPDAQFLSILGGLALVSPEALEDPDRLAFEPVGSGPYLLDDLTTDVGCTLVRNPDYWNADAFPYDRIEITLLPDVTARVNALKSGQIDVAGVDTATARDVQASGFETRLTTAAWSGFIFGDRRGEISPPIGDLKVRQAIATALDRVGFAEAVQGGFGNPSNQIGVEGQGGFYLPERADEYAYDLDAARELLAEAGYPDGFDIDMPYWPAVSQESLPYYEQALGDLGIRVNWITLTNDNAIAELSSGKFAVLPFGAYTFDFGLISPDGLWNPWHNTDAETEELLATVNAGTEQEAAAAIARLNEKILDEVWFAVLSHSPSIIAFVTDVSLTPDSFGSVPLQKIRPAE